MKFRSLLYDAARARTLYPRRAGLVAAALLVVGVLITHRGGTGWFLLAGILAVLAVNTHWFATEVVPAQSTSSYVTRRFDREQRAHGVASWLDVAERASRAALRREAHYLRPTLKNIPRRRIDPRDVGVLLARTGFAAWPLRKFQECWSGIRDVVLYVGGPGTNKTISLAEHGVNAPGALVTTSTRLDLAEWVQRARQGRPVHIFNPRGKGYAKSTVRWSILEDCDDYEVAQRRAVGILPTAKSDNAEDWFEKARTYLPVLLHAARIGGYDVPDVVNWSAALSRDGGQGAVRSTIINALDSGVDTEEKIGLINAFIAEPEKTRGSVNSMINQALAWVASETAREIGAAPLDQITLDIPKLILERETLHVIGHSREGGAMTPLISAVVAEIIHKARSLAADMPGGRLDPPLRVILDEAAVTVRLPLAEWTADAGGDGIHLIISVQSLAQLELCWGRAGAGTIKGNVGSIVVFGGGKDATELRDISELCGEYLGEVVHEQLRDAAKKTGVQRGELRWVPVMPASRIANMLSGQAIVLTRNLGGALVGRTPTVRDRKGWEPLPLQAGIAAGATDATVTPLFDSTDEEAA